MTNHITRNTRVNVSHETREVSIADIQPIHARPLTQFQVTGGSQQPVWRNWNAERRQRRCTRQLQAQEAGTTICLADTECEAQARVSSELRQMHEVRVWRPKHEAQQACVSETSLPKRDVQQREGYAFSPRHKTRISATSREIEKARVSQPSLTKRDNQQCEVRISAQQRQETHVLKTKRESCACSTKHELRVSKPCVSYSRRKGGSQKLKSP